jgi:hypothetical protein
MKQEYHNPPAAQVKTYAPSRPVKGCLEPNAPDARHHYDAELEARARYHENSGESESESWQAAADDLGDFEHWRWITQPCARPGCLQHLRRLEQLNGQLAREVDRLQAQLDAAALRGRDRRAA